MPEINDILNWSFIPSNLRASADKVISTDTKRSLKKSINKVNQISEKSISDLSQADNVLLKDIYIRFVSNNYNNYHDLLALFSKRDTRLLVWVLDYHAESGDSPILFTKDLKIALKIIKDRWRDSFIISLCHILLKNWNSLLNNKTQRKYLINLIKEKSEEYLGSRKDIKNFISNLSLILNENSPSMYAQKMIANNIQINKANELINQKQRVLLYEYFSEVALNYIIRLDKKNISSKILVNIYDFVLKHNSKRTTLLACSEIINSGKFNSYQKLIKQNSISLIGDPIKRHLWEYNGLSNKEEEIVDTARFKLNALLNKQFIKIFFEKLVQDKRRKNYWLRFIDNIDDIKFVGNSANYHYLKNIESISKYVDFRYKTTSRNQNTCALVIYSNGFVFVEFTDTGALYIYKQNNFTVNLNAIKSMGDLKISPTYLYACKNSYQSGYVDLNEEGRITHQGEWEIRFNSWMRRYYKNKSIRERRKTYIQNHQEEQSDMGPETIIRGKNYNPTDPNAKWESKLLYWSKKYKLGYMYSLKKNAWWKKK